MQPSVDPVWLVRSEILPFQFGPLQLGSACFKALSLLSNPFLVSPDLVPPLAQALAEGCVAVVKYATPVNKEFATLRFEHAAIRYATRFGLRYVVDLGGSFAECLKKFSKKSRGNLQRTVRKFATPGGECAELRQFRSVAEIELFRSAAIAISRRSYKDAIGWGFPEDETFASRLEAEAKAGAVRGYVLMLGTQAAAYAFCRIEQDVIVYKHIGYDESFAANSPGTALLYLILERLFEEGEFRLLDFDGTEYMAYKEFFATRAIRCARVVWFRPTIGNIALFGAHCVVMTAWRFASAIRGSVRRQKGDWASSRRLARITRRVTARSAVSNR